MSYRSLAKLPSIHQNLSNGSSHHPATLPELGRPEDVAMLKTAINTITVVLDGLNVNKFHTVSPIHTPVHCHVWKPDAEQFRSLVLRALSLVKADADEEQVRVAMEHKTKLNDQLVYIDGLLVNSEQSGRSVGNARWALAWLAKRARETYSELHTRPSRSRITDHNLLPATPKRVRWADQEYSTASPNAPGKAKFAEEIYVRFLAESARYNKHNTAHTAPLNGSAVYDRNSTGYASQGYSSNGSPNHGRTQLYVRNADNTVAPRSCLKPADENAPFIPPHPSYFSKDCELATSLNRGKSSSKK